MAEETLDAAVESLALPAGPCRTVGLMLDGAKGWTPTFYIRLVQDYGLEKEVRTSTAMTPAGQPRGALLRAQRPADEHMLLVLLRTPCCPGCLHLSSGLSGQLLCSGGPAPGLHVRSQGLRRGQDGPSDGPKMADRGQEAGVRVPLH